MEVPGMAGRKRTINRLADRGEYEVDEEKEEREEVEEDDTEEEDDDVEGEEDPEVDEDVEADEDEEVIPDEDDEDAPKPKKKKVVKKKAPAAKRTRAVKVPKLKAVWVIFDNNTRQVETFPYNQKTEAETFLATKSEEKKGNFYLQLVKVPMEEKA
jgi:hypothetical protein